MNAYRQIALLALPLAFGCDPGQQSQFDDLGNDLVGTDAGSAVPTDPGATPVVQAISVAGATGYVIKIHSADKPQTNGCISCSPGFDMTFRDINWNIRNLRQMFILDTTRKGEFRRNQWDTFFIPEATNAFHIEHATFLWRNDAQAWHWDQMTVTRVEAGVAGWTWSFAPGEVEGVHRAPPTGSDPVAVAAAAEARRAYGISPLREERRYTMIFRDGYNGEPLPASIEDLLSEVPPPPPPAPKPVPTPRPTPTTGKVSVTIQIDVGATPPQTCGDGTFALGSLSTTVSGGASLKTSDTGRAIWYCQYSGFFSGVSPGSYVLAGPANSCNTNVVVAAGSTKSVTLSPNVCN